MIQLAFEPAFDPFHTAFRVLRQLEFRNDETVAINRMKILDVYMAEPVRCTEIRLAGPLRRAARLAAACQLPQYGRRPTTNALFNRMIPIQDAAIQTLVSRCFLDGDAYSQGQALRTELPLSDALVTRITNVNIAQKALMTFLCRDLDAVPTDGTKGLKDRTGLSEYRYDSF